MQTDYLATIDLIQAILERPGVKSATERLLSPLQRDRVSQALVKMRRKTVFVAAVGSQGCGKSTLLNAILFNSRLLPEGEGVTTNIICYVHPAGNTEKRCEVHMRSGEMVSLSLSRETLDCYMDETHNSKNIKGVASIHCYAETEPLATATSFVDTPGLGSLMAWQDRETMSFVQDMSLGLYVLRGTPPMTASDAEHLRNIWKFSPEFIFIQNIWGESPAEVNESLLVNGKIITEVARKNGDTRPITIRALNIHAAAEEACNPQRVRADQSPVVELRELIRTKINRGGQEFEIRAQASQIVDCITQAIEGATRKLAANAVKDKDQIENLREHLQLAIAKTKIAEKQQADHERSFCENCFGIVASFQRDLRAVLRQNLGNFKLVIQADGGHLGIEDEFLSEIQRCVVETNEEFARQLAEIATKFVRHSAKELESIETSIEVERPLASGSVEDVSGTHFTEFIGKIVEGSGGLAGTASAVFSVTSFVTAIAHGSSVTAAVMAGASAVPVAGWVIAGLVFTTGLIMKKKASDKRRSVLLDEFTRISHEVTRDACQALADEGKARGEAVAKNVSDQVRAAVEQQNDEVREIEAALSSSDAGKRKYSEELRRMLSDLEAAIEDVLRLIAPGKMSP